MYLANAYRRAFTIVPHDTNVITQPVHALYIGGVGDITLRLAGDTADVVLKAVPIGTLLMVSPKLIKATGTTATLMIGFSA